MSSHDPSTLSIFSEEADIKFTIAPPAKLHVFGYEGEGERTKSEYNGVAIGRA